MTVNRHFYIIFINYSNDAEPPELLDITKRYLHPFGAIGAAIDPRMITYRAQTYAQEYWIKGPDDDPYRNLAFVAYQVAGPQTARLVWSKPAGRTRGHWEKWHGNPSHKRVGEAMKWEPVELAAWLVDPKNVSERYYNIAIYDKAIELVTELIAPMRLPGDGTTKIVCCEQKDLFDDDVSDNVRYLVYAVMLLTPQHRFVVKTKHVERAQLWVEKEAERIEPDPYIPYVPEGASDFIFFWHLYPLIPALLEYSDYLKLHEDKWRKIEDDYNGEYGLEMPGYWEWEGEAWQCPIVWPPENVRLEQGDNQLDR